MKLNIPITTSGRGLQPKLDKRNEAARAEHERQHAGKEVVPEFVPMDAETFVRNQVRAFVRRLDGSAEQIREARAALKQQPKLAPAAEATPEPAEGGAS